MQFEENRGAAAEINLIHVDVGVQWLISFLSADQKKIYCLDEAPSAEAIREAALQAELPADMIIEVSELRPIGEMGLVWPEWFTLAPQ